MRFKKKLGPIITSITMSAIATSCGVTSGGSNTLLSKVKKTHQVILAVSAFAPQDFQNPTTKKWTGYDIKILKGFAKTLGAKLIVKPMPLATSIQAVASRRADMTIDIYWNKNRAKVIGFSRPMLNYNDVVAVNSTHPALSSPSVSSLKGQRLAVVTGSAEVAEAQHVTGAIVKQYGNLTDSLLALSSGRVAADLQPGVDIAWAKKKNPTLNVKILGPVPTSIAPPVASLRGYYGVPKGAYSQSFLNKLNSYLKKIAQNGTEQKILNNYGMNGKVFLKGISSAPNTYKKVK